jgi:hypothetical protein
MVLAFPYSSFIPYQTSLESGETNYSTSQFTRTTTSHQQDMDATIVTAEGDRVTLSWSSQSQATYTIYNSLARTTGESTWVQGSEFLLETDRELAISVDGDLNWRELRDIQKAIKTINSIIRDFLSGDIALAMAKGFKIAQLESLSSLEASARFEQSVCLEQQFVAQITRCPPQPAEAITPKGDMSALEDIYRLTDRMMRVVQDSGVKPANLLKPLRNVFSQLSKDLSRDDHRNSPNLAKAELIKSNLLNRIEHLAEIEKNRGIERKGKGHRTKIPQC